VGVWVSSRITELIRTAPDWARVDTRSAEVIAWLDHARRAVQECDLVEVGILRVHLQFLDNDIVRHGAEIVAALRRVEKKEPKRRAV
jgi:hypothetical protein